MRRKPPLLIHLGLNTVKNTFRQMDIDFCLKKVLKILSASLTHSLARIETKQSSAWPPFYDTRRKSLVRCAFWGSDEYAPFASFHSFYLPLGYSSSSSKTISTC